MAKTAREQIGVDLPEPDETRVQSYSPPVEEEVEDTRPEWLPEKFKSPEAFAESYSHLENRLSTEAQERSQLQAQIEEMNETLQALSQNQYQAQQPSYDDQTAQLYAAYESDPIGTMAWLAQNAAQAASQQVLAQVSQRDPAQEAAQSQMFAATVDQEMERRYQDWNQVKTGVGQVLQEMPYLLPENPTFEQAQIALGSAYEVAKARALSEQSAHAQDARSAKLAAQTMSGSTGRQQATDEGAEQIARMRAALRGSSYAAARGGSF